MYFEHDPFIIGWLEHWLHASSSHLRWRATDLLGHVDCAQRAQWLAALTQDPDPLVRRTALAISGRAPSRLTAADVDLFSSDFMADIRTLECTWEWEYGVRLCVADWIPLTVVRVWMREEDDSAARAIAALHTRPEDETPPATSRGATQGKEVIPVIVDRRAVNQFTRSPRNSAEARIWRARGRPLPP